MPFNYQGPKALVDAAERERDAPDFDWCSLFPVSLPTDVSLDLINPAKPHPLTLQTAV